MQPILTLWGRLADLAIALEGIQSTLARMPPSPTRASPTTSSRPFVSEDWLRAYA